MNFIKPLIAIPFFYSLQAMAACSLPNGAQKIVKTYYPSDISLAPESTASQHSSSTTMRTSDLFDNRAVAVACTAGETIIFGSSDLAFDPDSPDYFMTNIVGENVKWSSTGGVSLPDNGGDYIYTHTGAGTTIPVSDIFKSTAVSLTRRYIQSTLQPGYNEGYKLMSMTTSDGLEILDIYIAGYSVQQTGCKVNQYDPSVNFGTIYKNVKMSGEIISETLPFNINLSCRNTPMSILFEGQSDNEYNAFVGGDTEGSASGVGVQIFQEENIVTPGEPVSFGEIKVALDQSYNFSARLVTVNNSMSAGELDIPVSFTILYE